MTTRLPLAIDALLKTVTAKIKNQEYPNIHSLLVAKNGTLVYEQYFAGPDQIYGNDVGVVVHSKTKLHDIRSISKSVISACIGIAIDQGIIEGVGQRISDFFPEFALKGSKSKWTIQHFLTMTTGLVWNENFTYSDPENDEFKMTNSRNPIVYVLNKPLKCKPGTRFNYNGGATQILSEIIERVSNSTLDRFVNEFLFEPLGIKHFEWSKYSVWKGSDEFAAPSGLRLTSRDIMKIGLLYSNKGVWDKKRLISESWIFESFEPRIKSPSEITVGNECYGYQYWIWPDMYQDKEFNMIAAIGNGGQNIFWNLENDIVVVTTAGNYNNWDIKNNSYALVKNEIYPLLLDL
jgi:CubicO group peptidase (beta-lactamase class C family)